MSLRACALVHCGSTSAVGECAMAVWMRIQSFAYPFSSAVLRTRYRAQVRRACSVNVDLNRHVFIFSLERFYSRLTLLLSGLPSAERPGYQPDLTEPVKNTSKVENVRLCEVRLHPGSGRFSDNRWCWRLQKELLLFYSHLGLRLNLTGANRQGYLRARPATSQLTS